MVVTIIVVAITTIIRCEICRRLLWGMFWVFNDGASFRRAHDVGSGRWTRTRSCKRLSCLLWRWMAVDERMARHVVYLCHMLIYVFVLHNRFDTIWPFARSKEPRRSKVFHEFVGWCYVTLHPQHIMTSHNFCIVGNVSKNVIAFNVCAPFDKVLI